MTNITSSTSKKKDPLDPWKTSSENTELNSWRDPSPSSWAPDFTIPKTETTSLDEKPLYSFNDPAMASLASWDAPASSLESKLASWKPGSGSSIDKSLYSFKDSGLPSLASWDSPKSARKTKLASWNDSSDSSN